MHPQRLSGQWVFRQYNTNARLLALRKISDPFVAYHEKQEQRREYIDFNVSSQTLARFVELALVGADVIFSQ